MNKKLLATVTFELREDGAVEMMFEPATGSSGNDILNLLMNCTSTMGRGVLRMCDSAGVPRVAAIKEMGERLAAADERGEMFVENNDGDRTQL